MAMIDYIDSHTAGEPTRVIVAGGPEVGGGPVSEQLDRLRLEADWFRRTVVLEPRGSDALVGALLCRTARPDCESGIIFFNNTGYLGMCGHGAMGVAVTLARLGRLGLGCCRLETPVGVIDLQLQSDHRVAVSNVPAWRSRKQVELDVPQLGRLTGDVAWGGNWFFLVDSAPYPLLRQHASELTDAARRVLAELHRQGITGDGGATVDHLEFLGPPTAAGAHCRNFVLCPGGAYDRSPCGTGVSAKLACLAEDGRLQPGQPWVQQGILGSQFVGSFDRLDTRRIAPTVVGDAYVTAEGRLVVDADDPFRHGIATGVHA